MATATVQTVGIPGNMNADPFSSPGPYVETFSDAANVTFGRLLGVGKFNYVYEAQISPPSSSASCDDSDDDSDDEEEGSHYRRPCHSAGSSSSSSPYVVKHLKECLAEEDSEAFKIGATDLAYEAEILSAVEHDNIVKFHGVIPFLPSSPASSPTMMGPCMDLVLEKLQCTLKDSIHGRWLSEEKHYRRGSLPLTCPATCRAKCQELLSGRLRAALEVARGLQHLHSVGIMHRDLKPDNIGFDASGTAKIFDFGLAKRIVDPDEKESSRRHTGMVGTFRYMAPEVAKCKRYGLDVDTYSYGLILWEICALETAFGDITRRDFQDKVIYGHKRPGLSSSWFAPLKGLMALCWSPDSSERPGWDLVVSILEQEIARAPSGSAPSSRRSRLGRRSSMPMRVQFSSECANYEDHARKLRTVNALEAPKKSRPKWGKQSSASMILQTTTAGTSQQEGFEDETSSSRRSRDSDANGSSCTTMGDRRQFARRRSFPKRMSLNMRSKVL